MICNNPEELDFDTKMMLCWTLKVMVATVIVIMHY